VGAGTDKKFSGEPVEWKVKPLTIGTRRILIFQESLRWKHCQCELRTKSGEG
jgi:hypothetical protein